MVATTLVTNSNPSMIATAVKVVRMSALLKREALLGQGLGAVAKRTGDPGIGPDPDSDSESEDGSTPSSPGRGPPPPCSSPARERCLRRSSRRRSKAQLADQM